MPPLEKCIQFVQYVRTRVWFQLLYIGLTPFLFCLGQSLFFACSIDSLVLNIMSYYILRNTYFCFLFLVSIGNSHEVPSSHRDQIDRKHRIMQEQEVEKSPTSVRLHRVGGPNPAESPQHILYTAPKGCRVATRTTLDDGVTTNTPTFFCIIL